MTHTGRTKPRTQPHDTSYWSYARTPAEVQRDLYREAHPQEPGLLGSWALREGEGAGARVHDASGAFRKCLQRHCRWEVRGHADEQHGDVEVYLCVVWFARLAWLSASDAWFSPPDPNKSHQHETPNPSNQ